jgi:hypothetical protein
MNARESIILSKILAELTAFLLHRGYRRFTTHVDVDDAIERITIEIPDFRPADSAELIQKCIRPREREIETYGWTLLGDSNLEMAGWLINTARAEVKGSTTVVILTRLQD